MPRLTLLTFPVLMLPVLAAAQPPDKAETPAPVPSIPPSANRTGGTEAPAEKVAPPLNATRAPDTAGPPASTPNSGAPDQSSPVNPR